MNAFLKFLLEIFTGKAEELPSPPHRIKPEQITFEDYLEDGKWYKRMIVSGLPQETANQIMTENTNSMDGRGLIDVDTNLITTWSKEDKYRPQVGDIAIWQDKQTGVARTHQLVGINSDGSFKSKGANLSTTDPVSITEDEVIYKVITVLW